MAQFTPSIGIVGCGSIAKRHAKNLQGRSRLFFLSRNLSKAERFAREFGGNALDASFEDLLSNDRIQAVIICSPPEQHFAQARAAILAGKDLLVEKPLCISPTELEQLEELLKNSKSQLMVAENYYYKPSYRKLRSLMDRQVLGELRRLHIKKQVKQEAREWKANYGALIEGGIHFVALLNGLANRPYRKLRADISSKDQIERASSLLVDYDEGIQAKLDYAWNRPALFKGLFQHSIIEGSQAEFIFESNGLYILFRSYRTSVPAFIPFVRDIAGYQGMIDNFLGVLEGREEVYSNFERAKQDLRLVFDAYELNARNALGHLAA